jgi:orotate phosphoribosyltransferase
LFARPRALRPYADALANLLRRYDPELVCGPLVGGAYAAQLVAESLDTDFSWSNRLSGTYVLARAGTVADRRVAIVDDAINAGSAVGSTAAAIEHAGGRLIAVAALLTLGAAPTSVAGAPVERLAALPSTLWPASTCPLCATGSPLTNPPPSPVHCPSRHAARVQRRLSSVGRAIHS